MKQQSRPFQQYLFCVLDVVMLTLFIAVVAAGYLDPDIFSGLGSCIIFCEFINVHHASAFWYLTSINLVLFVIFARSCFLFIQGSEVRLTNNGVAYYGCRSLKSNFLFPLFGTRKNQYDLKYELGTHLGTLLIFLVAFAYLYRGIPDSLLANKIGWQGFIAIMSLAIWETMFGLASTVLRKHKIR